MWTFKPGYLGVTIAVISILGGVLLGSLLNVTSHDEATTKYDYVGDISGLFDVSEEPQYIDYNPTTNYTGYTSKTYRVQDPTGLTFTRSSIANNYRVLIERGTTVNGPSGTINNDSNYPQANVDYAPGNPARGYITDTGEIVNSSNTDYAELRGFKITSVYDWAVSTFGNLNNYSGFTVNFTYPAVQAPTIRAYFGTIEVYTNQYGSYNRVIPHYYTSITINPEDQTFNVVGGGSGTYSMFNQYIVYGATTQGEVWINGMTAETRQYSTSLSLNFTSTTTSGNVYDYMLPSAGVTSLPIIDNSVIWDNDTATVDYDNQVIDILLGPTFDNGAWVYPDIYYAIFKVYGNDNDSAGVTFLKMAGTEYIDYNYGQTSIARTEDVGEFPAYMLRFDRLNGPLTISVYGVTSFTDYLNVTVATIPLLTAVMPGVYSLDSIEISAPNSSSIGPSTWSVYQTKVFMDTYNAVLSNPSIDLANYWPDMSSYRYAFQSFALYGDSITLNGVTYPVVNERVTINDKTYKLNNFYLSFSEQGDTSITFKEVNKTVDLGPTVDKTVSFTGNWGFSTALYEGHTDVKKVYDWSIKLLGDNLNTVILISLALVAGLLLVCRWLGMSFKLTDKLVIGGAGLFLVLLLVV